MKVVIDARATQRPRTSSGQLFRYLIQALAQLDQHHHYCLYLNGWPRCPLPEGLPRSERFQPRLFPLPDRLLNLLWAQKRVPLDPLFAPFDLFHADHRLPNLHRGRWVVSLWDLADFVLPERFPQQYLYLDQPRFRAHTEALAWSILHADRIIVLSEAVRQEVIERFPIPPERVRAIAPGLAPSFSPSSDPEGEARALARWGLQGQPYILYVGALDYRKNGVGLLEAYRLLRERYHIEESLVICGGQGYEGAVQEFHQALARLQLATTVQLLGFVPQAELPALYRRARLLLHPAFYEGFGLTPLEAMACGTPVVASRIPVLAEVLGDAALLVDPFSPEEIAEAAHRLLRDERLRGQFRERGLVQARQYAWERAARETLALYEELA